MIVICALAIAMQTPDPGTFDKILGVPRPASLWVKAGETWTWPTPLDESRMVYAMWRGPQGQANLLALPTAERVSQVSDGVTMAAADYAPVRMADGRTLEATEQWIIRSHSGKQRPTPSSIATNKSALRTEIRVFMDPTATPLGGDIALKLYDEGGTGSEDADEGEAYAGDFTITTPSGEVRRMHTGPGGLSKFTLDQAGVWAVRFYSVHERVVRADTLWFEAKAFGGTQ